jgi:hypothetical protein
LVNMPQFVTSHACVSCRCKWPLRVWIAFLTLKIRRAGVHKINLDQDRAQSEHSNEPPISKNLCTLLASWATAGLGGGVALKRISCAIGLNKHRVRIDTTAFNTSFNHVTKQCQKGFKTKRQLSIQTGPGSNSSGPLENADWKVNQSVTYKILVRVSNYFEIIIQIWCYGSQQHYCMWCPLA